VSRIAAACAALTCVLCGAALAQQLPFDPASIGQLSPDQKQAAMQALGIGSNTEPGSQPVPDISNMTPDQRQQLLNQLQAAMPAKPTSAAPAPVSAPAAPSSDQYYRLDDAGQKAQDLKPFGYDLFSGTPTTFAPDNDIPVPNDYVLGPGDTLRVQFYGQENDAYSLVVTRDGNISFPRLGSINVAGEKYDDVVSKLEDRIEHEMIGVSATITLGDLRSIRILLLGDVAHPGSYTVSSLTTITNALFYGGGVANVGSLRHIQLKRDGQVIRTLDLYDLLLRGDSSNDVRLQAGDAVFVPPVGARVAIGGEVKRPAIYELKDEQTVGQVLSLAGGLLASTNTASVLVARYDSSRNRKLAELNISDPSAIAYHIQDGDQLQIRRIDDQLDNAVVILGQVKYPGRYQWHEGLKLREVLEMSGVRRSDLAHRVYPALALLERTDTATGARNVSGFNLEQALTASQGDMPLTNSDRIAILSADDIGFLDSAPVRDVVAGKYQPVEDTATQNSASAGANAGVIPPAAQVDPAVNATIDNCPALDVMARLINSARAVRYQKIFNLEDLRTNLAADLQVQVHNVPCPSLYGDMPLALPYLLESSVAVYGEVQYPGFYPVADATPLDVLIQTAGGLTHESNRSSIEYVSHDEALKTGHPRYQILDAASVSAGQIKVSPGDALNFRPLYAGEELGNVQAKGEFLFPGKYGILRGERLSELMQRAGGLTPYAYPYGAIFTRVSARETEAASYKRAASELQDAIATAITSGSLTGTAQGSAEQLIELMVKRLEDTPPIGRVVIEADPTLLQLHAEDDPILEPGDAIYMPKRPISVSVVGQVLNAGTLKFAPGASVSQYIDRAGGFAQAADKKRVFILLPNGTAEKAEGASWIGKGQQIPPGSSIIVPRNATPFSLYAFSDRIFSIISSLALTTVALVQVSK